jgi:acyl transferase domain-containing protein
MSSVLSTFAPSLSQVPCGRSKEEALYLGSAKANIGHGEASSGSSSLIKVLLMMQKNMIVPHCGIKSKINHKFPTDLGQRNVHIARKPTPWERRSDPSKPRRVIVNNFSAAGGNTALLLEDAPLKAESPDASADPRSVHLVAVSAKSGVSIQSNLRSLVEFLKQNPDVSLGQLSYTTTARRMHHQHRVMLAGSSTDDICRQIETALQDNAGVTRPKSAPKIVFTFTGQGAQFSGMGKQLLEHLSVFRKEMIRLDQIGRSLGFPSMLPVIEADEEQDIGTFAPAAVQLASICMQIALSKLWASWNITPVAVVGHSLGEYAALNVAGVLSDADTLYLVGKRAELLQKKCTRDTHAMLVVRGSVDEIAHSLGDARDTIEFACINSPVETVLAGSNEAIDRVKTLLSDSGKKTTFLKVPYAFHSSQLDPMLSDLQEVARSVTFAKPRLPVLCPLDGIVVQDDGVFGPEYLARHSRQPVNMLQALLTGRSNKIIDDQTIMLEIGPHPAMGGMVRAVLGSQVPSLASSQRGRSVWQTHATTLKHLYTAGANIRWMDHHADFKASHQVLSLPSYSWNLKNYWIPYVHNWSLRKGDPPLVINGGLGLESTTIHRVVKEIERSDGVDMVVEADIKRADLSRIVQGHEVDGLPLCTPSVYADIALSLGTYLLRRYRPGQEKNLVDVTDMVISKALILRGDATQQLLQAHAEVDWSSDSAVIKFMSFDVGLPFSESTPFPLDGTTN